jgi:hypothetical protein
MKLQKATALPWIAGVPLNLHFLTIIADATSSTILEAIMIAGAIHTTSITLIMTIGKRIFLIFFTGFTWRLIPKKKLRVILARTI